MALALVLGSGRLADLLVQDLAALADVRVERAADSDVAPQRFGDRVRGATLVVDARRGDAQQDGLELARAALAAGAHWIDLARDRERVIAIGELDEAARAAGRVVRSGCALFPGLIEPFVRARLADLKRVNEVLIGFALGSGAAWDRADFEDLLAGHGRPVAMMIGGEPTRRVFWGDTRWFEHPAPVGRRRSHNLDAPDLALYLDKPYRAAGVRLSVALPSAAADKGLRFVCWLAGRGWVRDVRRHAARLARLGGGAEGAKGAPTSLTFSVRGMDAKSLPFERRISFQTAAPAATLEALPASIAARALLGAPGPGKPQAPGARPALDLVDDEPLAAFAQERGIVVRRGDLGGWHG